MITNRKKFYTGVGLLAAFTAVLVVIFMPVFNGHNGLSYLDSLYNSISKGSAYYIPKLAEEAKQYAGRPVTLSLTMADDRRATEVRELFVRAGAGVELSGGQLKVSGDLGAIMQNCLDDADALFANDGEKLRQKYGINERRVLHNWWLALKEADKSLNRQKQFVEAKAIGTLSKKAVECSYNYYKIEPQKISDKYGLVIFSLIFYVVYTLWYGFGIMIMLEGLGMRLGH